MLAAGVFTTLIAGDCVAFFLNAFPASETLWRLSVPLRRLADPFSTALGSATANHPLVPFLLLFMGLALPLLAYAKRNLITTAALGHTALAVTVLMISWTLERSLRARSVADLSFVFDPAILTTSNVTLALTAITMLALCGLNHIIYFRQLMLRDK